MHSFDVKERLYKMNFANLRQLTENFLLFKRKIKIKPFIFHQRIKMSIIIHNNTHHTSKSTIKSSIPTVTPEHRDYSKHFKLLPLLN